MITNKDILELRNRIAKEKRGATWLLYLDHGDQINFDELAKAIGRTFPDLQKTFYMLSEDHNPDQLTEQEFDQIEDYIRQLGHALLEKAEMIRKAKMESPIF